MTTSTREARTTVPSRPNTAEPVCPVASLIHNHKRKARSFIHGSAFHRWNLTQTWHYRPIDRSHPGDIAATLAAAAVERRVLAALLAYRGAGVEYIRGTRWTGVKDAVVNGRLPKRLPLLVVNTGHGVVADDGSGWGSYPQAIGDRYVGELWHNPAGEWWACRMGPYGGFVGMVASGPHRHADAAAYAVGFLAADF